MKLTKAQIVSDIIDRTGVYDPDMGYVIEDWNYEDNQIWGKFLELNNEAIV